MKQLILGNLVLRFKYGLIILKFLNGGQPWAGYYTVGNWPRSKSNNLLKVTYLSSLKNTLNNTSKPKNEIINDGPTAYYRRRKKLSGGYVWERYVAGNWIPIEKEVRTKDGYILKLDGTKVHETARVNNTRKAYGEKHLDSAIGPNEEYGVYYDSTGRPIIYDRKTGARVTNEQEILEADMKRLQIEKLKLQAQMNKKLNEVDNGKLNESLESSTTPSSSSSTSTTSPSTSTPVSTSSPTSTTTKVVNTRIVQPKKQIVSVKTPELWQKEYSNVYNNLTINQLEYLDSLGIDLSSAASMLKGINNYYGRPVLVVDNKFGNKSKAALNNILTTMPQNFRNPIPPEVNQYKYDFETPLNSNLFIVPEESEMTVLKRGGLISRNPVMRFKNRK